MIFWYKNSFLASVVSIIGCLAVCVGVALYTEEGDIGSAAICALIGIPLAIAGKVISVRKEERRN